jgi:peroxiredoxin family protein
MPIKDRLNENNKHPLSIKIIEISGNSWRILCQERLPSNIKSMGVVTFITFFLLKIIPRMIIKTKLNKSNKHPLSSIKIIATSRYVLNVLKITCQEK